MTHIEQIFNHELVVSTSHEELLLIEESSCRNQIDYILINDVFEMLLRL